MASDKHMEKARAIKKAMDADPKWFLYETTIRHIATALEAAEREGREDERKRCLENARGKREWAERTISDLSEAKEGE